MSDSIFDMEPGDYVKIGPNRYCEIKGAYGILAPRKLAKPSQGGFGVIVAGGGRVTMWEAREYVKRADLPKGAKVE